MMRTSVAPLLAVTLALAILFAAPGGIVAQEAEMMLKHNEAFGGLQRPGVMFTHEKHANLYPNCTECHHVYEYRGSERVNAWAGEAQVCSDCHKVREQGSLLSLRNALHENCVGCHRRLGGGSQGKAPLTCGKCHRRGR